MAHVGLVPVGHAVAVGIGDTRVEVNSVAVLVQLAGKTAGEPRCSAIGRVGPAEFFRGVQAVSVSVRRCVRGVVFVKPLKHHFTTVNGRPVHPFLEQRLVNIRNQVAVRVRVGRGRPIGLIGVHVGNV